MVERHPVQAKAGQGTQSTVRRENNLFYQGKRVCYCLATGVIISAAKGVEVNKSPGSGAVWK